MCSLNPTPFIRLPFGALSLKPCMLLSSRTHAHTYRTSHNQVGMLLPAAFITTPRQPDSPFYSYGLGVTIALGTMFALGVLATRAEPALNVLAKTVEKLTKGSFSKGTLVFAVCIGVGIGMAVGATKILFGAGLIWFICSQTLSKTCQPAVLPVCGKTKKTVILREPVPCNPAASTPLLPLIWCF